MITEGILLNIEEINEDDCVFTLFTKDLGLHDFFAPHGLKSKKRFSGAFALYSVMELFYTNKNILNETNIIK